jgi:hypothetical protein
MKAMDHADDDPPQYLRDCPMKPETEEEKEAREQGEIEDLPLDPEPSKLKLVPRENGPPKIRPFRYGMIGPDFTIGFFGKRREGKSFAMRHILWTMRDQFPRGVRSVVRRDSACDVAGGEDRHDDRRHLQGSRNPLTAGHFAH